MYMRRASIASIRKAAKCTIEEVMMMTVHSFLELIYWTSLFRITQGNAIRQRFLWYMYYIFRVHTIQLFLLRDTDILLEKATCMSGLIQTLLVEWWNLHVLINEAQEPRFFSFLFLPT